jgi:hypothetical protein
MDGEARAWAIAAVCVALFLSVLVVSLTMMAVANTKSQERTKQRCVAAGSSWIRGDCLVRQ